MKRYPGRREAGALLITVVLLLALMAAVAFGLNRGAGMETRSVESDYDRRNAAYLAEAAIVLAKWTNEAKKCGGANLAATSFAGGTLSATVTKVPPNFINAVATGSTANGASATLTHSNVLITDFSSTQSANLGGAVLDTTITSGVATTQNTSQTLSLTSGTSNALIYFPMHDIPANMQVLAASLTLFQYGSSAVARTVNLHRVVTQWDASATWPQARAGVAWSGGNYASAAVAAASVAGATSYAWNITGLVDSWVSGLLPNDGMLLRLPNAGQTATFYSQEADGAHHPVLNVTFAKPCTG